MIDGKQVKKSLGWLIFNFPWQASPKDDADKMCNSIHIYAENALLYIKSLEAEIAGKKEID